MRVGIWRYAFSQSKIANSHFSDDDRKKDATTLKSSQVVLNLRGPTKEFTDEFTNGRCGLFFGYDKSFIGRSDPSPLMTAPIGLDRKKGYTDATWSLVKGPKILPAATSSAIDFEIFSRAMIADEWLGGVKKGNSLPLVLCCKV